MSESYDFDGAVARLQLSMGPGRPSRASELVMNPHNDQAATRRRAKLLAAFDSLAPDQRADLLELVEAMAFSGTWESWKQGGRDLMRQLYAIAGLENEA